MDKKSPMALVHDNIESLDEGLEGFQRLFEAVSSNMRMQLSQLASGRPMPTAPSAAERELERRLKEREQQLVEMRRHLTEARKVAVDAGPPAEAQQRMETLETDNARLRTEVTALRKDLAASPAADLQTENARLQTELEAARAVTPPPAVVAASAPAAGGLPGSLLCALAATVKETLGPASHGVAFRGGASLGRAMAASATKSDDPATALETVAAVFRDGGVLYEFQGADPADLSFGSCGVRDALRAGGEELGGAACYLMCGLFSGAFEAVTGKRSKLAIVETGPTCRKTLEL